MKNLKEEQKALAGKIKDNKKDIKERQHNGDYAGHQQYNLLKQKKKYRHRHIAYCMMYGRTYEEIENKCREDNKPNMDIVKEIMDEYSKNNVCVDA